MLPFFSWDLSHLLMILFMFTGLNHPRKLHSSNTLCHTLPCSVNCPNHTTCESDPRVTSAECSPYEKPNMDILPPQNTTSKHFRLIPGKEVLHFFFPSKIADEKYFLFVSLHCGFHLNLNTVLK